MSQAKTQSQPHELVDGLLLFGNLRTISTRQYADRKTGVMKDIHTLRILADENFFYVTAFQIEGLEEHEDYLFKIRQKLNQYETKNGDIKTSIDLTLVEVLPAFVYEPAEVSA